MNTGPGPDTTSETDRGPCEDRADGIDPIRTMTPGRRRHDRRGQERREAAERREDESGISGGGTETARGAGIFPHLYSES